MRLTNEQIQTILDGAPSWCTQYEKFSSDEAYCTQSQDVHYLSDLREILELRQEVERLKAEQSEVVALAVEWGFLQGFNGALPMKESEVKLLFENDHGAIDQFELKKRHLAKQYTYQYANQLREQSHE